MIFRSGLDKPTVGDVLQAMCFMTPHDLFGQTGIIWTYADRALAIAKLNNSTLYDVFFDLTNLCPGVIVVPEGPGSDAYSVIRECEIAELVQGTRPNLTLAPGYPRSNLEKLGKLLFQISGNSGFPEIV